MLSVANVVGADLCRYSGTYTHKDIPFEFICCPNSLKCNGSVIDWNDLD